MSTLLKIIAAIVVLIIVALLALPLFVDPNDYKQTLSEQVEKATGRTLVLDGDIGLSVFPWVALELGPLSLSNAKGFEAEHFAKIEGAQVRIKLLPLLKKQLEMDTVVLNGLQLNLEKNASGQTNWEDFGDKSTAASEKTNTESSTEANAGGGLAALSIAGVELTDANIVWSDKQAGAHYTIDKFNLATAPLVPGEPTSVALDFILNSAEPNTTAAIDLNSTLMVDMEKQRFALGDLTLKTKASGEALPLPEVNLVLSGSVDADLEQQTARISDLLVQIQDLALKSQINASDILSETPSFQGQLSIDAFSLRELAKQLAIELPVMADDSTLELVALNSALSGSNSHIQLNDLKLTLDQSQLTGQFAVNNFDTQALSFDLALDNIDADRYLPIADDAASAESTQVASPATASAGAASELPLDALKQLNMKGRFNIGKLKVSGLQSQDITINVDANKGLIKLSPLSANLYQGQYQGNVQLDARQSQLKVSIDESLDNVQAGPLLIDLNGDDKISGLVNGKVKLAGSGKTADQIKQTLSGQGQFAFTDGAVKGINIADSIRKAKAVLKGEIAPAPTEAPKTDFSSLTGSFKAKNGVINNPDLALMSPLLRVNGTGSADLGKEALDYQLTVAIVGSAEGQLGKDLSELKGLSIPVGISGPFSAPKPNVDLATLLRDNATQKVKDKVSDKLKDKLGDELGGVIGGALLGESANESSEKSTESSEEPKSAKDALKDELGKQLKGLF